MLGADLGGLKSLSFLRHALPPFAEDMFGNSTLRQMPKHNRPLLRPRHFVGSMSSHDIASRWLVRFENDAADIGSSPESGFG